METLYTGKVLVRGGRDGSIKSDDGLLEARLAFPTALGGDGRGTNPEQLFGAGYAACFASTIGLIGRTAGHKLSDVEVRAEVAMLHQDGKYDLAIRLVVSAQGVDRATLQGVVDQAKEACPYSRATRGTIKTQVEVV